MNRRQFLAKGAAAGTLVWSVPTVITVARADAADVGSRPPSSLPPITAPPGETMTGPPLPRDLPGTLPFTGQEPMRHAKLGAAAVASGAALYAITKEPRR